MAQQPPAVESPEWWLERLYDELCKRQKYAEVMRCYYDGDPPLAAIADKARDAFRRLLKQARLNVCGLVVDATAERMQVDGVRLGDSETGDDEAWRIWQANNLDAYSDLLLTETVKVGRGFMLIAPNPKDQRTPLVTAEDMTQAIVAYRPGSLRERVAGLKLWLDDWTGRLMATLYLPGFIYKFQAAQPKVGGVKPTWERREIKGEAWPAPNPLGVVSLIELRNRPDLLGRAHSEIEDVLDDQDRLNKTLIDRMMAQEFAAFRQRWMTGYEVPVDEATGQPIEPFKAAVDRLWVVEDENVKFGEFDATDLKPYLSAVEADIQHIAARTRTPSQYLLGTMVNISGDALKAAESGLVSKVRQRMRPFGEAFEDVVRLYLKAAGDDRDASRCEVIWHNPEFRTEGELVDALTKMDKLGVPREALWERWGASQTEIARWKTMQQDENARSVDFASMFAPKPEPAMAGAVDGDAG